MENNENNEFVELTDKQMNFLKELQNEFEWKTVNMKTINKVYDLTKLSCKKGAAFINLIVAIKRFREIVLEENLSVPKVCFYCKSKVRVRKYKSLSLGLDRFICKICHKSIKESPVDKSGFSEENEVKADLHRKYEYSPEQENSDDDIRHGIDQ